jgi:hypothetical protein
MLSDQKVIGLINTIALTPDEGSSLYSPKTGTPTWIPFGNFTFYPNSGRNTGSNNSTVFATYAMEQIAPYDCYGLRLTFSNYIRDTAQTTYWGEMPNYNPIRIKGKILLDSGIEIPLSFGGRETGVCSPTGFLISDPVGCAITAGSRYTIVTKPDVAHITQPSAPFATASGSSSGISAGNYFVAYKKVWADGTKSPLSIASTQLTTTSGQNIVITSPANPSDGSIGYEGYLTMIGASASTPFYGVGGIWVWGTDMTIKAMVTSTNQFGVEPGLPGIYNIPTGPSLSGGSSAGGTLNAIEWATVLNYDLSFTGGTRTSNTYNTGAYGPVLIEGLMPLSSKISVAIVGDSREQGVGDNGYRGSNGGGYYYRIVGIQTGIHYNRNITPFCGQVKLASSGETLLQAVSKYQFSKRETIAGKCTHWATDYGVNDLKLTGGGSAPTLANLVTFAKKCLTAPWRCFVCRTIEPFTNCPATGTGQAFSTIADQTMYNDQTGGHTGNLFEAYRRAYNRVLILGSQSGITTTNELLWANYSSDLNPASNPYAGGNGAATQFASNYPFVQGSESLKVAGATKIVTTDYTYLETSTINGVNYASGVTLLSAPANGASVTMSYTGMPGFKSLIAGWDSSAGTRTVILDPCGAIEVDANGVLGTNGGWWRPTDLSSPIATYTGASGSSTGTINTSGTFTHDQYQGKILVITADPLTSSAIGQASTITSNTTSAFTVAGFSVAPSSNATIVVANGYTYDGGHCSTQGYLAMISSSPVASSIFVAPEL